MRRQADLDSNNWVAAGPYCNGRATGFYKVLTRSYSAICAGGQKTDSRRKASVVGFHCPVCGTTEIRFLLVLVIMLDPIQVDFDHEHEHENDGKADQRLARLLRQPK